LSDLPVELQRCIVSCLSDYDDIKSVSDVNTTLHAITEEASTWKHLCFDNYTQVIKRGFWLVEILLYKLRAIFWTQCKNFRRKIPYRSKKSSKRNDFTQLWRQWPCLFPI